MAFLIDKRSGKKIEVQRNNKDDLLEKAEELGVPIGCTDGLCGSCRVKVTKGIENLTERTQKERDMGLEEDTRLLCQCEMKKGDVEIDFESYF